MQHEVCAQLKRLLRGCLSVEKGERDGTLVAPGLAQRRKNFDSARQIVTIYDDRIEFSRHQDFATGGSRRAHLDRHGHLVERRPQDAGYFRIPADEERFERHAITMLAAPKLPGK